MENAATTFSRSCATLAIAGTELGEQSREHRHSPGVIDPMGSGAGSRRDRRVRARVAALDGPATGGSVRAEKVRRRDMSDGAKEGQA